MTFAPPSATDSNNGSCSLPSCLPPSWDNGQAAGREMAEGAHQQDANATDEDDKQLKQNVLQGFGQEEEWPYTQERHTATEGCPGRSFHLLLELMGLTEPLEEIGG